MALPEHKILAIIAKQDHITVELTNRHLMKKLWDMENRGLVEFKDRFRDCFYYGKPDGKPWKLDGSHEVGR